MTMTQEKLNEFITAHKLWLEIYDNNIGKNLGNKHLLKKPVFPKGDFSKCDLNFNGADLRFSDLSNCILSGINFEGSDLSGCNLSYSVFIDSNFSNCTLYGSNFHRAILRYTNFEDSNLSYVDLSYTKLNHVKLKRSNLHHADFNHADFIYDNLEGVELSDYQKTLLNIVDLNETKN